MDSKWEVELATWLDSNNIQWERSRRLMFRWTDSKGKRHRYYPDFYLSEYNLYLDPKNKFLLQQDAEKLEAVRREHGITLIYGLLPDIKKQLANHFQ